MQTWNFTPEIAAGFASMFYLGITGGRLVNGFFAMKFSDRTLIRVGLAVITLGISLMLIPLHATFALVGFAVIGLGCAPIYPCIIHMTPDVFGAEKSQAMIGFQMAFAYTGFMVMPPLFGVIADYISIRLLPIYLVTFLVMMIVMHETVVRKKRAEEK